VKPQDLVDTNLVALVIKAGTESATGVLTAREDSSEAQLFFVNGLLLHAVAGNEVGDLAVIDALHMREPTFQFAEGGPAPTQQTVHTPIGQLVPRAIASDPRFKDATMVAPVTDEMLPPLPYRSSTFRGLGLMAGCLWLVFAPLGSCVMITVPISGPRPSALEILGYSVFGTAACAFLIVLLLSPLLYTSLTVTATRLSCGRLIGWWSLQLADVSNVEWVDRTVSAGRDGGTRVIHNLLFSTIDGRRREMRTDMWIGNGLGTAMWLLSRQLPRPEAAAAAAEIARGYYIPALPKPASGPPPSFLGRIFQWMNG